MGHSLTLNYGGLGYPGYDTSIEQTTPPYGNYSQNRAIFTQLQGLIDSSSPGAFGIPMCPILPYEIVPLALGNATLATAQIANGTVSLTAGTGVVQNTTYLPISSANATPYAGAGVTVYDITGQNATNAPKGGNINYIVERSVTVTGVANTTLANFTIVGYDMYGQYLTCTFAGPVGANVSESNKTFSYVQSVSADANTTQNVTVGTGDTFGMPWKVSFWDKFLNLSWNEVVAAATTTGFTAADATNPPTAITTNVRGSYKVQSTASNGSRRLVFASWLNDANNITAAYGIWPG